MLSIGRALMARPRVLLLDEPSLGLAPIVSAQIMQLIRSLAAERGLAVLLVEQNARSALSIADRGVVLNLGRVVADDARRRRSPATRACAKRTWGSERDALHRPDAQRDLHRRDLRGGRARARADLAGDADRQLRPGRRC